jgi:hypothetical protein
MPLVAVYPLQETRKSWKVAGVELLFTYLGGLPLTRSRRWVESVLTIQTQDVCVRPSKYGIREFRVRLA